MLSLVTPVLDASEDLPEYVASLQRAPRSIDPDGELIVAGHGISQRLPHKGGAAMLRPIDTAEPGFGPAMRAAMQAARGATSSRSTRTRRRRPASLVA